MPLPPHRPLTPMHISEPEKAKTSQGKPFSLKQDEADRKANLAQLEAENKKAAKSRGNKKK